LSYKKSTGGIAARFFIIGDIMHSRLHGQSVLINQKGISSY
jgi:hypothetical protein